jgi:hypothetical protein
VVPRCPLYDRPPQESYGSALLEAIGASGGDVEESVQSRLL